MTDRNLKKVNEVVVKRVHWDGVPLVLILTEIDEARQEAEIKGIDPESLTYESSESPLRKDYTIFQIIGQRDETEEEFLKRVDMEKELEETDRMARKLRYEQLRKEFEN